MYAQVVTVTCLLLLCHARAELSCQPQSQPDSVPCGVRGKFKKGNSYLEGPSPIESTNLSRCRDLCVRRGNGCLMFALNDTAQACNFFRTDAIKYIQQGGSSDTIFYSQSCFKCAAQACPAIPDPSVNLLDNPGFEDSDTYVGPWLINTGDFGKVHYTHPQHPGINSANDVHVRTNPSDYSQDYRQCPGQLHRAEFDFQNVNATAPYFPRFQVGTSVGSASERSFSGVLRPHTGATKVTGFYTPFRLGSTGSLYVTSLLFYNASFDFDNAVVRPVDYSSAQTIGEEKVVNGGFEAGLQPWKYSYHDENGKGAKFEVVSPGLDGTSRALRWYQKPKKVSFLQIKLFPQTKPGSIRPGKLHRLRIRTRPQATMYLGFKDETGIFGSTAEDQYFYAEPDMFPFAITFTGYPQSKIMSEAIFDELSIREIEEV